jgi:hypothetical protein
MSLSGDGLQESNWRKSRRSIGNGECVEVASASGKVAVRDSKDSSGPVVRYPAGAWRTFIAQTRLEN